MNYNHLHINGQYKTQSQNPESSSQVLISEVESSAIKPSAKNFQLELDYLSILTVSIALITWSIWEINNNFKIIKRRRYSTYYYSQTLCHHCQFYDRDSGSKSKCTLHPNIVLTVKDTGCSSFSLKNKIFEIKESE